MASAVFGGVIRDVLANDVPLIFRKEIYASACLLCGICFIPLDYFWPNNLSSMLLSMSVVMSIRYLAVKYKWSLSVGAE
ncbi:MAG: TRIC cation channel family protein [Saprospiraceae bacterium]